MLSATKQKHKRQRHEKHQDNKNAKSRRTN